MTDRRGQGPPEGDGEPGQEELGRQARRAMTAIWGVLRLDCERLDYWSVVRLAADKVDRLRAALAEVAAVEPKKRPRETEGDALRRAQGIARQALEESE